MPRIVYSLKPRLDGVLMLNISYDESMITSFSWIDFVCGAAHAKINIKPSTKRFSSEKMFRLINSPCPPHTENAIFEIVGRVCCSVFFSISPIYAFAYSRNCIRNLKINNYARWGRRSAWGKGLEKVIKLSTGKQVALTEWNVVLDMYFELGSVHNMQKP